MVEHSYTRKSANIILKAKFETGKSNKKNHMVELQKFVDYIARQEAIRKDNIDHEYSKDEIDELERIEKALGVMEEESDQPVIKDIRQMDKYIDYMTRKKAILENKDNEIVNGAFSNSKRFITQKDVKKIKESVVEAKNNNSVMFQDVISFDNDFLEREGYYDPKTNQLNENILYEATKSMMEKLKEKEGLIDPFWFATIHRNTEHIHIHVTSMERENTREIMEYEGVLQARGKRKQSTLDDMIFRFGSKMLDRTNEFEKISKLRKDVPLEIKESVRDTLLRVCIDNNTKYNNDLEKYLAELKKEIPINTRGYNELPKETKEKVDRVTEYLTKDNPKRHEYDNMTKKIDQLYQDTYGKRYSPEKYYEDRKIDLNGRMGNAVVSQIKKIKQSEEKRIYGEEIDKVLNDTPLRLQLRNYDNNRKFKTEDGRYRYEQLMKKQHNSKDEQEQRIHSYKKRQMKFENKKNLRQIERVINDDLHMYRAKQDFEQAQRMVEQEKVRQSYQSDFDIS